MKKIILIIIILLTGCKEIDIDKHCIDNPSDNTLCDCIEYEYEHICKTQADYYQKEWNYTIKECIESYEDHWEVINQLGEGVYYEPDCYEAVVK